MISCERRHYLCNFSYQTVASDSNDILNCLDKHFDSVVHSCFFFWIILVTQVYMHRMVYEIDFRKVFINKNRLHSICKSNKWVFYIRTLQHNFYISINFINSKFPLFLCLQYDAHTHFVVSYWTQFGTDTHTQFLSNHIGRQYLSMHLVYYLKQPFNRDNWITFCSRHCSTWFPGPLWNSIPHENGNC